MVNEKEIIDKLILYIHHNFKSKKEAANHWGMCREQLSAYINGHKPINNKQLLSDLGYKRVVKTYYEPVRL